MLALFVVLATAIGCDQPGSTPPDQRLAGDSPKAPAEKPTAGKPSAVKSLGVQPIGVKAPAVKSDSRVDPVAAAAREAGSETPQSPSENDSAEALLRDVTRELGLESTEPLWPDGVHLTPEITPGGVALIDFDQDGDLDIYQICHCPPAEMPASFQAAAANKLFRQESDGTFVEVPGAAGLADAGYGHGAAIGDIDNDGDVDLFVTNYGVNRLYVNEAGEFRDITAESGIGGDHWSSAAAFFDYDRDGFLDLFVVHFGLFDPTRRCGATGDGGDADYCGPHLFSGVADQLFRNNRDGTFTDVSQQAGITVPARGWGVLCVDLTDDGWPDIYVCNDEEPNQLWINEGDGTFLDEAMLRGAALNGFGRVEASMGVTVGDVNGDGLFDLFMTHVASETNTLYTSTEGELFDDRSPQAGMSAVDLPYTGWGCGLVDIDHDADLDLAIANGRVAAGPVLPTAKLGPFWNRYAEPNLLFLNDGSAKFTNVSEAAGRFFGQPSLTRGLAFGDLDNDGDVDLITNSIDNRLKVYRNDAAGRANHWVQVRLFTGKRDAIGARLRLTIGATEQVRFMLRSYSYLASNDPRVHFGLGDATQVDALEVRWPDGQEERFRIEGVDRVVTIRQGEGKKMP